MKYYRNTDTGAIWTEEEINTEVRRIYEYEPKLTETYPTFDEYLNHLIGNGLEEITALYVACRETGDFIDRVDTIEEGLEKIARYEDFDKLEDTYTKDFYDVVDQDHGSVIE